MKKNEGLSEQVYNYLLLQILSNELKPGEKIAETKIAQEFNFEIFYWKDSLIKALSRLNNHINLM